MKVPPATVILQDAQNQMMLNPQLLLVAQTRRGAEEAGGGWRWVEMNGSGGFIG